MAEISRSRSISFFFSILLQLFISGFSDDSNPPTSTKVKDQIKNRPRLLLIFLALAIVVGLLAFLFKLWQKKKREEQYSRLLRLFEEDDNLELDLDPRDRPA